MSYFKDKIIIHNIGTNFQSFKEKELLQLFSITLDESKLSSSKKHHISNDAYVVLISNIFTFDIKVFRITNYSEIKFIKSIKIGASKLKLILGCPPGCTNCISAIYDVEELMKDELTDCRFVDDTCIREYYLEDINILKSNIKKNINFLRFDLFSILSKMYVKSYRIYIQNKYDFPQTKDRLDTIFTKCERDEKDDIFIYTSDELYDRTGIFFDDMLGDWNMPCIQSKYEFMHHLFYRIKLLEKTYNIHYEEVKISHRKKTFYNQRRKGFKFYVQRVNKYERHI